MRAVLAINPVTQSEEKTIVRGKLIDTSSA
jgi:hypothetical protein